MKKTLLFIAFCASFIGYAQITTTTATYTAGAQGVQRANNPVTNNNISTCADTLVVTIPNGNYIYSVDIEYSLLANNPVWTSDMRSYVALPSHAKKEPNVFNGTGNNAGTQAYTRSGLTFANGVVASGQLKFVLHAFRTFGPNGCNTTNANIVNNTFKVTVHHGPAPTCFPPTNVAVTWVMSNKARVSWTTGGATSWQIEFGAVGFTPGTGTLVSAPTNPFTITGLTPNTNYDFYVRDFCGVGNVSVWSTNGTFRTLCTPVNAAYTQNFDGAAWTAGTGALNTGNTIDPCWNRNPVPNGTAAGPYGWGTRTGATGSANTGPTGDHTTGSAKYIYAEASNGVNGNVANITSQLINLVPLNNPEVEFYYHMYGIGMGTLNVDVWSHTSGWQTVYSISGQQQTSSAQAWNQVNVQLPSFADDTIQLRFSGIHGANAFGDVAVDDVKLKEGSTCPPPTNLTQTAIGIGSATINWTASNATSWDVQYGLIGFTLGSGTTVTTSTKPYTVTGLTGGATYSFYVRERCSATDTSAWIGPLNVPIPCAPINAPFFENFNGSNFTSGTGVYNTGDALASCFLRTPGAGTSGLSPYFWGMRTLPPTTGGTGPNGDYPGGGRYAYTESSSGTIGQEALFILPTLNLAPLTTPELRFWYHMFGNGMGTLSVDVYKINGTVTSAVYTKTGQQSANRNAPWQEAIVNLSAFAGDTVVIVFRGTRGPNQFGDMAIDEVTVANAPTCFLPTNFAGNNITGTSVDLSWITGGATNWNIAFGPVGFTPGATFTPTAVNPFTLGGLTPSTTYHVYVRDSCGVGDVSAWVGPLTITTGCAPIAAPYTENFDGPTWTPQGTFAAGIINSCWQRSGTTNYWWKPGTGATPTANSGPNQDNTTGTGKYLYTETSNGGNTTSITGPQINLSPLTVPELSFFYHMNGALINRLRIQINNGGAWVTVDSILGQQQATSAAPWLKRTISLSAYANDTIQVRFVARRNGGNTNTVDIAIDDVDIHEAPSCPDPTNLAATNITSNSATISWTTGGATNWNIDFGAVGFTPGPPFTATTTNPYTINGLLPNTDYHVYVRDSCAVGDVSNWVGPILISIGCAPLAAPYNENFDGASWVANGTFTPGLINSCWTRSDTTVYWWKALGAPTPTVNSGPDADHTSGSGKFLYTETSNGGNTTSIISPSINLVPLNVPELSFWYHMYGSLINKLEVQINNGTGWTTIDTKTGQQQTSSTAAWQESIISLAAYADDTIQLRFIATRNNGNNNQVDIAIDDVDIHEAPACPKPSLFVASGATATTVQLDWTTGGATVWQVEYGPVGYAPGTGTLLPVTAKPFTVTGLTPNTIYDFYVRDSCGVGSVSTWEGPATDTTLCGVYTTPYTENFDGPTWISTPGGFSPGVIDLCWNRSSSTVYWWRPRSGVTPSVNTGPDFDHTTGSGKYLQTETGNGGTTTTITGPSIDLSPLLVPELSYWYHMYGAQINKLEVQINNGTGWTTIDTKTGQQQTSSTAPWLESIISLSSYSDDTIQLRFVATRNAGANNQVDISIDDVDIHETPNCPKPSLVVASNATPTTIQVDWTTGGATAWHIEYGPSGFTPGSGTIVAVTAKPYTVTGLSPNTIYDFYVRDSCGIGAVSAWEGPAIDTTLCGIYTAPYTENFDGTSWVPAAGGFTPGEIDRCWTRSSSTQFWWKPGIGATPTGNTGPSGDHTTGSGKYIYSESQAGSTSTNIISPEISLVPLTNPQLRFWYHMYGSLIVNMIVQVNDGTGWVAVDTITGQQQTSQTALWQERVVSLTAYANDTVQIRFISNKTAGNINTADVSIDDVKLIETPTCLQPTNFQATASTTTSVTLSWTTGGATTWNIEYGPIGFVPGNGTVVSATTNPFTVTGLSPSQQYHFYVRDSCAVGNVSFWTGPIQYNTLCGTVLAPYYENFDVDFNEGTGTLNDSSTISTCWSRNPDSAYHWGGGAGPTTTAGTGPTGDHTSGFGNYVYVEASLTPNGSVATLVSPLINLSPITNPELHFWYHMWTGNGTQGKLRWEINTGTSWTKLDSLSGNQGNAWQEMVVDLSTYANQTIQLRFWAQKGTGPVPQQGDIAIDDLSIISAINCAAPTQLVASAATLNSIQIGWTAGTATAWQIEYGPLGFVPGSGTVVNAPTNPFVVTGLTAGTTYDFYVRSDCSPNGFSVWAGPITDSTLACPPAVAAFTFTTVGLTFTFDASASTGGITSYSWDFGDGNNGAGVSPVHTYAVGGNYTVTLIVENNCSNTDTITQIAGPCVPITGMFNYTPTGLAVNFATSAITGTSLLFDWDFGDGTTGTGASPAHTYAADGVYTVVLIVTDACQNMDTLTSTITVCGPLTSNFSWTQNGLSLTFTALSPTAITWAWQFGDGATDTGATTSHTYAITGTYQVRLVVTNLCGQSKDTIIFIPICITPVANWTYTIISSNSSGMTVQFDGTSSIGANNFSWDFGDGTTNTTSAIPVHTYNVAGLFWVVQLTITNSCGQSSVLRSSLAQIGIDEELAEVWMLYPNPATDEAIIKLPSTYDGEVEVQILNMLGEPIYKQTQDASQEIHLDVSAYPQGSYFVEIMRNGKTSRQRLQIQR